MLKKLFYSVCIYNTMSQDIHFEQQLVNFKLENLVVFTHTRFSLHNLLEFKIEMFQGISLCTNCSALSPPSLKKNKLTLRNMLIKLITEKKKGSMALSPFLLCFLRFPVVQRTLITTHIVMVTSRMLQNYFFFNFIINFITHCNLV